MAESADISLPSYSTVIFEGTFTGFSPLTHRSIREPIRAPQSGQPSISKSVCGSEIDVNYPSLIDKSRNKQRIETR
jgi:hypothetical protein